MTAIEFYKMSGSGNDFILIDNRDGQLPPVPRDRFAAAICRRRLSVGADGLIIIENAGQADFKWHFLNADGSEADMCGNGARCAARFAHLNGIARPRMTFDTRAGRISAEIRGDHVKIRMTDPSGGVTPETIRVAGRMETVFCINTGVPHAVLVVDDIDAVDIDTVGPLIRYHEKFAPAGTNANFIQRLSDGTVAIRTYERGVEAETLACGTGAVAGAIVAAGQFDLPPRLTLKVRSGLPLKISFAEAAGRFNDVYLEGDARVIYRARLDAEAVDDIMGNGMGT